ncbi:hypothetical protein L593_11855 [Salinarchaeum sp. Harcht-Bsk1]|nr:hypothetical protein L593_11855 [Salinarchaeum sp. Harcht-Bsk1]
MQALGAASAAAIAGCSSDGGGGSGDDGNDSTGGSTDAPAADDGDATGDGSAQDEPQSPEAAARQLVDHLFAGEYEAGQALFVEAYQSRATPAILERLRLGFNAAGGAFQEITGVETSVRSGLDAVDLTLQLERTTAPFRVTVTQDVQIRSAIIAGEYERASYADAGRFDATEHTLEPGGCQLGATVTTPADAEQAPGVVLVHGSGPSDRDLTVGANKPYRDLAEGLASRGVAVLRYEKRTFACNVAAAEHTVDHVTVDDALHALSWFRNRDDVLADDVAVVGHSLGAMMAPEIARRDGRVAGAVGLAAPTRPLADVFLDQVDHLASVGEHTPSGIEQQRNQWQRAAEQIRTGNFEDDESLLGYPGALWRSLDGYDPVATAEGLDVPQHYLQGGRDYQVTVEDDFAAWQSAFGDADDVALSAYDPLNHAFLPGQGPSVPQAYAVPNQVSESVVADLAAWLQR